MLCVLHIIATTICYDITGTTHRYHSNSIRKSYNNHIVYGEDVAAVEVESTHNRQEVADIFLLETLRCSHTLIS
jgi:hypothetical protein